MNGARGSPKVRLISSLAMLAVVIGGVTYYAIRRTNELLDIGVNDHVQCAIAGTYAQQTQSLVSQFAAMPQSLLDAAGADYAVVSAHRCTAAARAYIHVILRRGPMLVSVILTPRGDQEDFPRGLGALHTGSRDGYAVTGFESGGYLAYIVSALPGQQNKELAGRLALVIDRFAKN